MIYTGVASHLLGGIAFLVLALLLVVNWRRGSHGTFLLVAALVSSLSAFILSYEVFSNRVPELLVLFAEIMHSAVWVLFLLRLLAIRPDSGALKAYALVIYGLLLCAVVVSLISVYGGLPGSVRSILIPVMLILAVTGLLLVELLYRNTREDSRWAVKYLYIGVGALFAYDIFLYSHGVLFNGIDNALWNTRGAVSALIVPLIAVAASRNPEWSPQLFVSRRIVFYTTSLIGIGIYLLIMATGGYYISVYGGSWGTLVRNLFLFSAFLLLVVILFSGQARARLRVFLSKHFFAYRYDYREEWLRLIRTLSMQGEDTPLGERAIKAVAQIVESPGGAIWLQQEGQPDYVPYAVWNFPDIDQHVIAGTGTLPGYLRSSQWIVDVNEYRKDPASYDGLVLPEWLEAETAAWLVVPLIRGDILTGFMVLAESMAPRRLSWEDLDLLKTVGIQVAGYISLHEADRMLTQSRQFETFNRLTAFIMHDIKNLILQQSLILKNAATHRDNADFINTTFETVENSVRKMKRLLGVMQQGNTAGIEKETDLATLLVDVVAGHSDRRPVPVLVNGESAVVRVDPDRASMTIGHLVRNARDAATADGYVEVRLKHEQQFAVIEIYDSGPGMDARFIRERLFQPFDTTKGSRGMGIGAYQAREFARAAGGFLQVNSTVGKGTTFRLGLPLAGKTPETDPSPDNAAGSAGV